MGQKLLIKMRVKRIIAETPRIKRLLLVPMLRSALPPAQPGDHVILLLENGMRRRYSLCADTADDSQWEIAVQRELAGLGGSAFVHDAVREDDILFVTYPQSAFQLAAPSTHHIFVAGGIGLTPFLSMIPELGRRGDTFDLHVCAHSAEDAGFTDRLQGIPQNGRLHSWFGSQRGGRIDLHKAFHEMPADTHAYCCGPARMIDAFVEATAHWPAERVHVEHFSGLTLAAARQGEPFEVEIASDGRRLAIPADRSLLQVLREAGIVVDASCEGGACGSCRVNYLKGEPIHRDFCLRPEERAATMASCVSRAKTTLTLAL